MQISAQSIQMIKPDDWHLHVRDGEALRAVIGDSAKQFARAIIMPNLKPPVQTVAQAQAYKTRIEQALQAAGVYKTEQDDINHQTPVFQPLMSLYLTDNTSQEEIKKAVESGIIYGVKLYPAGATTNSDAGVTDLLGKCSQVLEVMQELGLPLQVHGEVTDPEIDVFDREAIFIDKVMIPLRQRFPSLRVVFEHLTTEQGVQYVTNEADCIGATITPQHLLYSRNTLFQGGLRPHFYCLPILKRERHRQVLLKAATSGDPRFFLGTDSAPHAQGAKESDCGCAGCYSALHAILLYAHAFEQVDQLDKLEGFASIFGPQFYGLPINQDQIVLQRKDFAIPKALAYTGQEKIIPLAAGTVLPWSF